MAFNIIWVFVLYPFRYSLENKNYNIYSCVILRVFSISVYFFATFGLIKHSPVWAIVWIKWSFRTQTKHGRRQQQRLWYYFVHKPRIVHLKPHTLEVFHKCGWINNDKYYGWKEASNHGAQWVVFDYLVLSPSCTNSSSMTHKQLLFVV